MSDQRLDARQLSTSRICCTLLTTDGTSKGETHIDKSPRFDVEDLDLRVRTRDTDQWVAGIEVLCPSAAI